MVVKLNPTLLGREALDAILHERLGYHDIVVPERGVRRGRDMGARSSAMVERLEPFAAAHGRSLGVKFSNTLVVENNKRLLPGERAA